MNQKTLITRFISCIASNELKKADATLKEIVNEKIKDRIRQANEKLDREGSK